MPGAGGFLLSEESESLAQYFRIGAEMITYRDDDELAEKIRYFLNHPDERDAIARAGHQRVRREHLTRRVLRRFCSERWKLPANGASNRGRSTPICS